jgi:hypothetical protein
MRTRMSGGVGRVVSDDGPYPISVASVFDGHYSARTNTESRSGSVLDSRRPF